MNDAELLAFLLEDAYSSFKNEKDQYDIDLFRSSWTILM